MTAAGWIFMISSVTLVTSLVVYCYWKVLSAPEKSDHMHAPLDIDTKDL